MESYYYETACGCRIGVDFHPAETARAVICYYHGGGLLFGTRRDLPAPYIEMFNAAGYHLLCFDYLLAPESDLEAIQQSVAAGLEWFYSFSKSRRELEGLPYILFGRSAGAYLALCAAARHTDKQNPPAAVLSFYGYSDFFSTMFRFPNDYYCRLPLLSEEEGCRCICDRPVSEAPPEARFLPYVWARQTGNWVNLLCGSRPELAVHWSLSPCEIAALPPLFITASTTDQDVPFVSSLQLASQHPHSVLRDVSDLEHDFDRDSSRPEGRKIYKLCLDFLDGILSEKGK